ncbi:MAG: DNA topoisomerase III [Faecalibacterium sp.]|nr:DNA topoisomerase III [Ruminococcus sp.]MCM1484987.1 DNA topoisomerase III [Faecalibacterium sp.]
MAKALVLAEKPSVARDIARVLGAKRNGNGFIEGDKYVITWALGHLVTLADPDAYDKKYKSWQLEDLPMLPQKMKLVVIKQTAKQYKTVSSLMNRSDIDRLIIATDAGREGELVARWIMMKAHWKKPSFRLWISSQTDRAIKDGFNNLKPAKDYDNLYYSAQARAEADWLVGLNVTRALTCKHNAQLSAGRVQTPTLAMIVAREDEILKFRPSDYFTLQAVFKGFNATFRDSKNNTRFSNRDFVEKICQSINGKNAVVAKIERTAKRQNPPAAYDLTELQRDANKIYGYSAKQTLSLMQSLYEFHKVLTYPRTDSRYITDDVVATIPERLKSIAQGPYQKASMTLYRQPINAKYIVNNAKVTDHHAIIPTEQSANFAKLSFEERNIYDLVVKRFIAVLSSPFEYDEVKLTLDIDGNNFHAKGKIVKSAGWKEIYGTSVSDDEDEETENKAQQLPDLKEGMKLPVLNLKINTGKTRPPARYTEATLLSAMENPSKQIADKALKSVIETTSGLGTPATRADIIEKLFDNFSIERNGKEIRPTAKGQQLIKIVPPDLKSAELTAKWEQQLQNISKGTADMKAFIAEMRKYSTSLVSMVISSDAKYVHDNMTKEKCPECGKYLLEVNGKKGKMLICQDRECGYRRGLTQVTNARCPNCHKKLELRGEGEKKSFVCKCGYREKLSDFNKRKQSDGAGKYDVQKYMKQQNKISEGNNAFADLLKDWSTN